MATIIYGILQAVHFVFCFEMLVGMMAGLSFSVLINRSQERVAACQS